MKFDVIIIGGGHSGLSKGIELLREGKKCLAITRGQSSRRLRDESYDFKGHCAEFRRLGGEIFQGDSVLRGRFDRDGRLLRVETRNHGDSAFEADEFYLSTGSFFSGGLVADISHIFEPIFHLDVEADPLRSQWVNPDFFGPQPFMKYGVKVDCLGRALKGGKPIANLHPIGSIVSRQ